MSDHDELMLEKIRADVAHDDCASDNPGCSCQRHECERCHRSFLTEEALEEHWKTVHVVGDN